MIYLLDPEIVKPPGEGYDGAAEALVMPNIYEVAKRAGVSTATVSRSAARRWSPLRLAAACCRR